MANEEKTKELLDRFEKYCQEIERREKKPRGQIRIVVGMSGGVDSSLTACLLKEFGFDVVSLHMRNWDSSEEDPSREHCTFTKDWNDVKVICETFGIKHVGSSFHPVEFIDQYWNDVFEKLLDGYSIGQTPNPDLFCNKFIKFDAMLNYAIEKGGADYIATGHYAQLGYSDNGETSNTHLLRAIDHSKDQSYFLSFVNKKAFEKSLFPLGQFLKKEEVRVLARDHFKFPNELWGRKDSVGICFIGKRKFKDFLSKYIDSSKGNIVSIEDKTTILGEHDGASFYTIGQGMCLSGMKEKWFVCEKDFKNNILYVCPGNNHPSLLKSSFTISNCHWLENIDNSKEYFVKVRYNQREPFRCKVSYSNDSSLCDITLADSEEPARGIASGQIAVLYDSNSQFSEQICVGGGIYI
ncbi:predicted protein [Naegleria gruberi]|uniref:tRNA-5-taurinomethyluridine 2-sulfurtransferase n=1 Tax=Naegleria gruberi TaxID=5762 RepID=D2V0M5_NAEGR|nr:uncharacterized protein NAEGRDRAFT_29927 [Naegleria gruberi]EFC49546.1 predicted protein [Naegleria gruberi]|eukprot:XP_002682290.1 predicted protein [Naegleria gruberi strain NEG-M]